MRERLHRLRRCVLAAAAAAPLALAGCQPGSSLAPLPSADAPVGDYTLGSGDEVRVITFGDQTLTGQFRVDDSGDIAVPLLGTVSADRLTTRQLGGKIEGLLKSKNLFKDPSVSVEVVSYRPIFVLGEVNKPGEYPYQPGMTTLSAVAVAGGFTYRAVEDYASVIRSSDAHAVEGKVGRGTAVRPGDVITIFERRF